MIVSLEQSARTQINFENAACRAVPTFALFRESGRRVLGPAAAYVVKAFSHGLHYRDLGAAGETRTVFDAAAAATLPPPVASDLAPLPAVDTWANARQLGAVGDGATDDTAALQKAIAEHRTVYLPLGKYVVRDTLRLRTDTVLVGLHPDATQLVLPDRTPAFQGVGAAKPLVETARGGEAVLSGLGVYTNGINPRAVAVKWMAGARSTINDVRFLGGHGTAGLDGKRENPYNNTRSGDPDANRRWDSQYPSLWVTDGGGGTFFDIWTPSTFAQAGMLVSNTSTSGRVYQMSSEHHVRYEVQLHGVANWELHALQTEAERGESGAALQLEVVDSHDLLFTNFHAYRVISSDQPFPYLATLSGSRKIRFRGLHSYSNSKVSYDVTVLDRDRGLELRQRELAWLDVGEASTAAVPKAGSTAGAPVAAESRVFEPGASVVRLAGGFHNVSGGATDPKTGDLCFVDARWQRIHRWSVADHRLSTVSEAPLQPVNLAFDAAGDLLVVSYAGKGAVYALKPGAPLEPILLEPAPAAAKPAVHFVVPVGDWRLQRDGAGELLPRPQHYTSPDGTVVVSATQAFTDGAMSWGVKSSDLIRAFGLQQARAGERVYLTSEAEVATWSARVADDGSLVEPRAFVQQGGEGLAVDSEGNVFVAAGAVYVYDRSGTLLDTLDVPERPVQLVFGGPDRRTLFMPARHSLYAVRTKAPGR